MSRLIDADALKEHIDKLPALPDGNFAGNHSALKALINMQPTIEPELNCSEFLNNWISCDERLPENYERVLTTISIPNRESKVRSGYYHNGLFSNDNGDCWSSTDPEVKGWCKLPEPYEPEEESE